MAIDSTAAPTTSTTTWRIAPNEVGAHAYSDGPGWTRSVCRAHHWSVVLQEDPDAPRCPECDDLIEGRITESEQRALAGDR